MANVSYLRTTEDQGRPASRLGPARLRPRLPDGRYLGGGLALLTAAIVAVLVILLVTDGGSLSPDASALAMVGMPFGGGKIQSVYVTTGADNRGVPAVVRGDRIWPTKLMPAGQTATVQVVIKRAGWISWLTGSTDTLRLRLVTPTATLSSHYLTLGAHSPLRLTFNGPVSEVSYGNLPSALRRRVLRTPRTQLTLPRLSPAGSMWVAAAPRTWESSKPSVVAWFPAGAAAAAVASPAPGSSLGPTTPISLTFNKTVAAALGASRPPVNPRTPGVWHTVNSHTIVFRPQGFGYGLGAKVTIGLPAGVHLVGASSGGPSWSVAPGSTLRLQELLAELKYLPLRYHGPRVANSPAAQEAAAIHPPHGSFTWRYRNVPGLLHGMWSAGADGELTKGALMAFENDHNLTADGVGGPAVWQALITAAERGKGSTFGYTFVSVNKESSPESVTVWHSGKTVVTTPANTGVAAAPTASGTFAVFEHTPVTTMTGTNPDGSQYSDPGIQWVSYFNGGDALHAFDRASFGSPQSDGCVEMPLDAAAKVYPYTPIGTIVNVS